MGNHRPFLFGRAQAEPELFPMEAIFNFDKRGLKLDWQRAEGASMKTIAIVAGMMLALISGVASAQTTTIGNAGPGSWTIARINIPVGQTFTVPPGVDSLSSASLGVGANGSHDGWSLSLHLMTGGVPGPALVTDASPAAPPGLGNYAMYSLTPSGGLPVSSGQVYLIRANLGPNLLVAQTGDYYSGGSLNANGTADMTADTYFTAAFTATPAPVPTLSEWTMILLGLSLAGGAAVIILRRPLAA